jgi:glycosyltransferase involved in cell wall biosynthesis
MRILNVNVTIDPVSGGGTAERSFQLSRSFSRLGQDCALLTLDVGISAARLRGLQGVQVTALRCLLPRYYLFALPEPRIQEQVAWADVVHLTGHWTLLNALVYRFAQRFGKPYIVCPAGGLPIYGRSRTLKTLYNAVVGMSIIRHAASCVAIANNEIAQFQQYGVQAPSITLIPNGVDPTEFVDWDVSSFRVKFGLPDAPLILFMGRLNSIKGPDLLLHAFAAAQASVRGYHLVFAGPDDGLLDSLKSQASGLAIDKNVHFIGHVSGKDKASAYRAADLLVIPSRQEAMSIVVLEAGVCDRPVLLTDRCGFDDVERIGGGRVVTATVDGLKSGLLALMADVGLLRSQGQKLGEFVRRNFLWDFAGERYLDLFSRVLRPRGRAI